MTQTLWDPVQRYHLSFEPDCEDVIVDVRLEPGGGVPPHVHPRQVERFEILEGRVRFQRGAERVVAGPGETVVVPAGIKHAFDNAADAPAHFRCRVSPALNLVGFFEETTQAARDGLYTRRLVPKKLRTPVVMAGILERYGDDVEMAFPPKLVQRLIRPLARFDRGRVAAAR